MTTKNQQRQTPTANAMLAETRRSARQNPTPTGRAAQEWGERIEISQAIGRGGKPSQDDKERQVAVYDAIRELGFAADWQQIADHVHNQQGFTLDEQEVAAIRATWNGVDDTNVMQPIVHDCEEPGEAIEPARTESTPDR